MDSPRCDRLTVWFWKDHYQLCVCVCLCIINCQKRQLLLDLCHWCSSRLCWVFCALAEGSVVQSWVCSSSRAPVVRHRGGWDATAAPELPKGSCAFTLAVPSRQASLLLMATAGEESISWNIYLLNNLSSWPVVVLLVETAVVHSECDKSVGSTRHLVFFIVPDAGQWPGNTQGGRQQPPLKTHGETAAPGTWVLTSPLSCSTSKPSAD